MTELKLRFKKPEHGWVPVTLIYREEVLEIIASDVPNNPVQELIDTLWNIVRGESGEV